MFLFLTLFHGALEVDLLHVVLLSIPDFALNLHLEFFLQKLFGVPPVVDFWENNFSFIGNFVLSISLWEFNFSSGKVLGNMTLVLNG